MELRNSCCNGCEATARQANSGENVPSFDSLVPTRLILGATFGSLSQPLPRARYSEFHINSSGISALGNGYPPSRSSSPTSNAFFGCAPEKPGATRVKVPPVELDGSRPKGSPGGSALSGDSQRRSARSGRGEGGRPEGRQRASRAMAGET